MKTTKSSQGVTLVEMMLVLVLISAVLMLSLRQYRVYRDSLYAEDIRNDVNQLLFAAAQYYRAECNKGGALDPDPAVNPGLATIVPLDITNTLINGGYLRSTFPKKNNPWVNYSGGFNGYSVQLNQYLVVRNQPICDDPPLCTVMVDQQIGTTVIWRVQVAVHINNITGSSTAWKKYMQNFLNGDCYGDVSGSPAQSDLCSAGTSGNFLIFERMPRFITSTEEAQSNLWATLPVADQFNQQYNSANLTTLLTTSHTPEFQYFYCSS